MPPKVALRVPPLVPPPPPTFPKGKKDTEKVAKEAAERLEKQGDIHVTDRLKRFTPLDGLVEILCIPFIRNGHKCNNPAYRFIHKHVYQTYPADQTIWCETVEKGDHIKWSDRIFTIIETDGKKMVVAISA